MSPGGKTPKRKLKSKCIVSDKCQRAAGQKGVGLTLDRLEHLLRQNREEARR